MDNNSRIAPEWTSELEQRYQYVQKKYDNARFIGLDVLKILLGTAITLAAVPIAFYEKVTLLFAGRAYVGYILPGFLSFFLSFSAFLPIFSYSRVIFTKPFEEKDGFPVSQRESKGLMLNRTRCLIAHIGSVSARSLPSFLLWFLLLFPLA